MKKLLLLFLLPLLIMSKSPLTVTETDHRIIDYTFNHKFGKAEKLIEQQISAEPDNPKYYFLNVVTTSLKDLALSDTLTFETRYEYRQKKNDELIEYTEGLVKRFENKNKTLSDRYYLANLYGYLGRMYGIKRSHMSAFSNAKKGKATLEEIIEQYPDLYDAYLLLGMFEYYADRIGGVGEFVAGVLGFSGSRNKGIKYLKIAAEKGDLNKPMAMFILGEIYFSSEKNNFAAEKYFGELIERYPDNSTFYDWYVRILMNLHLYNEAGKFINNDPGNFVTSYTKALYYFGTGSYQKASDIFEEIIRTKNVRWRGAFAYSHYLYALSSIPGGMTYDLNSYELREEQAKILNEIKNNLPEAEAVISFAVKVDTLKDGVQLQTNLSSVINIPEEGFIRSKYEFYSGVYFFKKGEYKNAEKYFSNIAQRRNFYKEEAAEYLIEIYKRTGFSQKQYDNLDDLISSLDDDDLEFSLKGLKE